MVKEIKKDKLTGKVFASREEMGKAAASYAADKIRALLKEQLYVNAIFAAAPSQSETLKYLIKEDIDWLRVRAFHMDEYIGLKADSPNTFASFLTKNLFSRVKFKEVYLIGTDSDSEAVCQRYTTLLKEFPPDLVCLGIGENGHIAFNDPHIAEFNDKELIKVVDLDLKCREQQVNDKTFASLNDVPTHAVTLTVPALTGAKHLVCTVPAPTKAWAVNQTFAAEISEQIPSTIMRTHDSAVMFADVDSASLLL